MVTHEERVIVISALRRYQDQHSVVPNCLVRPAADRLRLTPRQVRRLIKSGVAQGRRAFVPNEDQISLYYATAANAAKAVRDAHAYDIAMPVRERQFRRGLTHVDQALVAGAKQGYHGVVTSVGYGRKRALFKGHTYSSDASPVGVLVRQSETGPVVDVWEENVIDESTRFALAFSTFIGQPDMAVTIATLAAAVQGYEADDGTFLGGKPDFLLTDNGAEFKGAAVTSGLLRVGVKRFIEVPATDGPAPDGPTQPAEDAAPGMVVDTVTGEVFDADDPQVLEAHPPVMNDSPIKRLFTDPYSPWSNGTEERFHQTFQRDFASEKPGWVDPKWPVFKQLERRKHWKANPHLLLTKEQLDALISAWIMKYNFEHPHRSLDGQTPFEAWKADTRELERVDEATLRLAMLSEDRRYVVDRGRIRFDKHVYYSPALGAYKGQQVEVRYLPARKATIEVFLFGRHVTTATREDYLGDAHQSAIKQSRVNQIETHLAHTASAERLKTARARKELQRLGFTDDQLPTLPEPHPVTSAARRSTDVPHAKDGEAESLRALLNDVPNSEENIA